MIRPGRLGLVALLLIAALGAGAGWLESQISRPYWRRTNAEQVFVDIPRGTSRLGIADILARNGIIRNRLAFFLLSEWHHRRHLQAGEYLFDQPSDSREVFWKISHGQIFVRTITVPEGWTMFDIAAELDRQGICSRDSFLEAARETSLISDMAPKAQSLEGFLFPSTYEFTRHTTCDQVVKRMTQDFRSEWAKLNPPGSQQLPEGLTPVEVVSMASLVERETPNPDERPLVAGVFYNRLRIGDPLQCDPTVQYALEMAGEPRRDVRPADLRINSPYNTYEHKGLPPGPIGNPGEASLRAALAPTTTDYLYFVANDQGGHFFSRTLAEHNRNVARLRRLLAGDALAADPPPVKTKHRGHS
jgi:UPF0755 protein